MGRPDQPVAATTGGGAAASEAVRSDPGRGGAGGDSRRGGRWARIVRGARAERRPFGIPCRITDMLVAIVCASSDVLGYVSPENPSATHTTLGIVLFAAAGLVVVVRRQYPVQVLAAVLVVQVIANLQTSTTAHTFAVSVAFALYEVARQCGTRTIVIAGVAVATGQLIRDLRAGDDELSAPIFGGILGALLFIALGLGVRRWKEQGALNRTLLADRAVAEERRRIARELHDIVAHHVTTMYLMSGGARSMMDRDPDTARAALVTLEASGRTALNEMRQLLGVLRSSEEPEAAPSKPQPGVADLDHLVAESCAAGLPTEFEVVGERRAMPLATGLALFRITQEALTNSRKYAGKRARARVHLAYLPDRVVIDVSDNGSGDGKTSGMTGGGYGLLGMRERVAVHGGILEVGPREGGGFRVAASIPLPPEEQETQAPGGLPVR